MEVYLDNSATTPLCKTANEKITLAMDKVWGNPSSLHEKGIEAFELLSTARRTLSKILSCDEKEIYFTSGGTESNNISILGAVNAMKRNGNKIITTSIEHPSVKSVFEKLAVNGYDVVFLPVDKTGKIDLKSLEEEIDEKTVLISVMAVNNEVGSIQPVEEVAKIIKRKNSPALFHIDAVQAFGKIPLNARKLGADLISVSSHKIHGPKGVGALYIKNGVKITPTYIGGSQERDIRPGTEPMLAIAGFLGAMEELKIKENLQNVTEIRNYFVEKLKKIDGVILNSGEDSLPYIVNLALSGLPSETVLNFLSDMEIYVSSGSACAKGHKSYVLKAMGIDDKIIDSSLRISFSRFTTKIQLDYCLDAIEKATKTIMRKR